MSRGASIAAAVCCSSWFGSLLFHILFAIIQSPALGKMTTSHLVQRTPLEPTDCPKLKMPAEAGRQDVGSIRRRLPASMGR
jgi:hypothetical protein